MRRGLLFLFAGVGGCAGGDEPLGTRAEPKTTYVGPMIDATAKIEAAMSDTVLAPIDVSGMARMA